MLSVYAVTGPDEPDILMTHPKTIKNINDKSLQASLLASSSTLKGLL
jgi:hypothetical protein